MTAELSENVKSKPHGSGDKSAHRRDIADAQDTFLTAAPENDQMFLSPQKQIAKDDYMMESSGKKGPRDRSRSRTVSACASPM